MVKKRQIGLTIMQMRVSTYMCLLYYESAMNILFDQYIHVIMVSKNFSYLKKDFLRDGKVARNGKKSMRMRNTHFVLRI